MCVWMSVSWRGWIVCKTSGVCYSALSFLLHHLYNPAPKSNTKSFFPFNHTIKTTKKHFQIVLVFLHLPHPFRTCWDTLLGGDIERDNNLWQRKFFPHHMAILGAKHWKNDGRWERWLAIGGVWVRDGDLSLGGTQCERWWPWSNELQLTTRTWLHVAFSNCNKHEQCDFNTWFIWRAMTGRVG